MRNDEIFDILKKALMQMFEIDENKISLDAKIYEDLDIDSIDAIDLIDHIKRHTGYRLEPADFKSVKTLGDIVDAVSKKYVKNS